MSIRRRQFLGALSGAAAWPLAVLAQQSGRMRRIGWLGSTTPVSSNRLNAFKRGLADLGWIDGRNLVFEEFRSPNNDPDSLRSAARDLAALRPDLIFVANSPDLAAIRRATGTIPILFATLTDPVGQGFVSSLAQPGGNITGFAGAEFGVSTKALELLKKTAPSLARIAFIYDLAQPAAAGAYAELEGAAPLLALNLSKTPVRNAGDIEHAIGAVAETKNSGLFILASPMLTLNLELIVGLAIRNRLPAIHPFRYFAKSGGLASYGVDDLELCRRAASYADRILRAERPADLPVQLPTKFESAGQRLGPCA
jgi:putative ABC transport system substrate-binding protein